MLLYLQSGRTAVQKMSTEERARKLHTLRGPAKYAGLGAAVILLGLLLHLWETHLGMAVIICGAFIALPGAFVLAIALEELPWLLYYHWRTSTETCPDT